MCEVMILLNMLPNNGTGDGDGFCRSRSIARSIDTGRREQRAAEKVVALQIEGQASIILQGVARGWLQRCRYRVRAHAI